MDAPIGVALAGLPAAAIAARVRAGEASPADVVREHLDRIDAEDSRLGAFQVVRRERAVAEAERLGASPDLRSLPLAGVPIAIKDNLPVGGEPMLAGCGGSPPDPSDADHEIVRRLRAAGAIVIGLTRVPELCVWGATDGAYGVTRNPWDPGRTPGGSSGGSAAAVAAGMVPLAIGNDGMGSIRIPAAACGVFGLKPGPGVVPCGVGKSGWFGMIENGPLATTVEDAALALAVLSGRPELGDVAPPERALRIAVSTRSPMPGGRVDAAWARCAAETAELLGDAGHAVTRANPPYPPLLALGSILRWCAGTYQEAEAAGLALAALEPRNRRHAQIGRLAQRLGLIRPRDRERWAARQLAFFREFDLLLTPTLAASPIHAADWSRRSWTANMLANTAYAPFPAPWNYAGFPAAAVPAGIGPDGMPLSVQLVTPPGGERQLLAVARQIEVLRPWQRLAP